MNSKAKKQTLLCAILIGAILVVDQIVKIWVKTTMMMGEEIFLIGDWCRLHFVENEGMAFGMAFGGVVGKYVLSLFRLLASGALLWYLIHLIRKGTTRTPVLVCLSMIFVGAVGNLLDSCFYGLIFSDDYYSVAQLFPPEGGYAPFLQGKVVDMFYFPLIDTVWPHWLPFVGGRPFQFFNAIFNVADASITVGVIWLIVDQLFFAPKSQEKACPEQDEKE